MLVMLICIIVGAVFFRWLQDEEKLFGEILGVFTGALIGGFLSIAIGLAVVPTTTTKIIDDNKLYYVGEDGTMGRIDIDRCTKRKAKLVYGKYEEDHQCRFDCPIFGVCEKNPC
jgi:hypothetical protein